MNQKVKDFIEKQKQKRILEKQIEKLENEKVWAEYKYQGQEVGSQEELNKITADYDARINKLKETLCAKL